MSRREGLSTQTGKIWLSIRKNNVIDLTKLNTYLGIYADRYAYICHNNDIEPESGEVEGIHYHVLYDLKEQYKRDRLMTTLNHIVDILNLENAFGVNIEKYDSFEGCLQYLTHKNNPEKTQHSSSEIITNIPDNEFNVFYNVDLNNVFSFDQVYSCCLKHTSKKGVIHELWNYYTKNSTYQRTINDLWDLSQKEKGFKL